MQDKRYKRVHIEPDHLLDLVRDLQTRLTRASKSSSVSEEAYDKLVDEYRKYCRIARSIFAKDKFLPTPQDGKTSDDFDDWAAYDDWAQDQVGRFHLRLTQLVNGSGSAHPKASTESSSYGSSGNQTMNTSPIFSGRSFWVDPDLCFVLMPFTRSWSGRVWTQIRSAVQAARMRPLRADEIFSTRAIIQDIWEQINGAKVIIADVSEKNPNVVYELGIAHALGKPVVLLTQSMGDIPFDTTHLRYLVYTNTDSGYQKLTENIVQAIDAILGRKLLR